MPAATSVSVLPPIDHIYPHRDRDHARRSLSAVPHLAQTPPPLPMHEQYTLGSSLYEQPISHYSHTYMPERAFPPSSLSLTFPAQFPSSSSANYSNHTPRSSAPPPESYAYPTHAQWQSLPAGTSNTQAHVNVSVNIVPPPLPQLAHKVWILDCKTCQTFLTNRGMKAVLLLRPHVALYSTDALPMNCSAYTATLTPPTPPSRRPPSSAEAPRTCECLTQTLCCHGCGNGVGYMIVIPCARCTSSISATNRSTNGHRFVFHSSEIVASERHYVPDEPGVLPIFTQPHPDPSSSSSASPPAAPFPTSPISFLPPTHSPPVLQHEHASPSPPGSPDSMPPLMSPEPREQPPPPPTPLRAGAVLFWHHMARNGEIPGVADDRRARPAVRRAMLALDR